MALPTIFWVACHTPHVNNRTDQFAQVAFNGRSGAPLVMFSNLYILLLKVAWTYSGGTSCSVFFSLGLNYTPHSVISLVRGRGMRLTLGPWRYICQVSCFPTMACDSILPRRV